MASSSDTWIKEYNEAVRIADDINGMISGKSSLPASGPETQRHASAIRRKITILGTRLDGLQSLLSRPTGKPLTEKELNRRKDMVLNLRSKANQMASAFNMYNIANRDSLLGPDTKPDAMSRTVDLDNSGLVDQDEGLEKLEETVISTKHIALAVGEELDLHTRLIVCFTFPRSIVVCLVLLIKSYRFNTGDLLCRAISTIKWMSPILAYSIAVFEYMIIEAVFRTGQDILKECRKSKRVDSGCWCMCMVLAVMGIVILLVVVYLLLKYL
ncbi:hypothetical protein V6N12_069416 [Hibiscus sabdariffa]|uniref:Uncharacterized protein n=1 Tax=Hibiscus sabdariffa TaxID=183260 RepID=A0ABR2FDY8_9ROSI